VKTGSQIFPRFHALRSALSTSQSDNVFDRVGKRSATHGHTLRLVGCASLTHPIPDSGRRRNRMTVAHPRPVGKAQRSAWECRLRDSASPTSLRRLGRDPAVCAYALSPGLGVGKLGHDPAYGTNPPPQGGREHIILPPPLRLTTRHFLRGSRRVHRRAPGSPLMAVDSDAEESLDFSVPARVRVSRPGHSAVSLCAPTAIVPPKSVGSSAPCGGGPGWGVGQGPSRSSSRPPRAPRAR
jgi:hypothetical protein